MNVLIFDYGTPFADVTPFADRSSKPSPSTGRLLCVYLMSLSLATTWPFPRSSHRLVSSPSTPTGPRACIRLVLMPTCR